MEQKHFVMVSTKGGKLNIGAIQHNQSTWLKKHEHICVKNNMYFNSIGDLAVYHGQQFLNLVVNVIFVIEPYITFAMYAHGGFKVT